MEIINNLNFQLNNSAVCIGKFDGIHQGHRMLLEKAQKSGYHTVMFTFVMNHIKQLYGVEEKHQLAQMLGIDVLIEIPFDEHFKNQSPEEFVRDILHKRCDAKLVVVGDDFRFGRERSGDVRTLKELGKVYGYETTEVKKVISHGDVISSTRIRNMVESGDVKQANALLGTPYFLFGEVQKGHQIGRKMSTPTANIYPALDKVLPPYGVYAVLVDVDGKQYQGVGNLGRKPTIGDEEPLGLEVWLFDYDGNLYGKDILVYMIEYIREERKFDSIRQLQEQIATDANRAKEILS